MVAMNEKPQRHDNAGYNAKRPISQPPRPTPFRSVRPEPVAKPAPEPGPEPKPEPVTVSKDDDKPIAPEEALDLVKVGVIRLRDDIIRPFRRGIRSIFDAVSSGIEAASDELSEEEKKKARK